MTEFTYLGEIFLKVSLIHFIQVKLRQKINKTLESVICGKRGSRGVTHRPLQGTAALCFLGSENSVHHTGASVPARKQPI